MDKQEDFIQRHAQLSLFVKNNFPFFFIKKINWRSGSDIAIIV